MHRKNAYLFDIVYDKYINLAVSININKEYK